RKPLAPGSGLPQFNPLQQLDARGSENLRSPPLTFFPRGNGSLEQLQSPLSHAERLLPRVLTSDALEPALAPHPLDVAAERGGGDLQSRGHVGRRCDAEPGGGDEDVDLAVLHPEPAQRLVVELGHDAVEQPQTHRETFAGDIVDGRADLGHTIYLYIQVN